MELVSIGSELLSGKTVNTNAAVIGAALLEAGIEVTRVSAIGDESSALKTVLEETFNRASYVIITGGLGPTHDDITRKVLAEIFDSPFHLDKGLAADLEKRYGKKLVSLKDQATVPFKATIIPNHYGTAPGFIFDERIFVLPGVPNQMSPMLKESVIPFLKDRIKERNYTSQLYITGLVENDIDLPKVDEVTIGICPSAGYLSLYLSSKNRAALQHVTDQLGEKYKKHVYSTKDPRIERALQELMTKKGLTLGLAESCTGGAISAAITKIAGASDYFLGGIISYSNQVKEDLLHVGSLKEHGAVSEQTVKEMAQGVITELKTDYAIAVSGIAGPSGGSQEKPVGMVWIAVGTQEKIETFCIEAPGTRGNIITYSTNRALGALVRVIVA